MTKEKLVKSLIKYYAVKRLVEMQEAPTLDPKRIGKVEFYTKRLPLLDKSLRILMSAQYRHFVKDIAIISPKPSTFKVTFNNDYFMYLTYNKGSLTATIEGKKYAIINIEEAERASKAITEILKFSNANLVKQEADQAGNDLNSVEGGGFGSGGSIPGGDGAPDAEDDNGIPSNDGSEVGGTEDAPDFDIDSILNKK